MNAKRIASALLLDGPDLAARQVPYYAQCEETIDLMESAWFSVRDLRHQRTALLEIWPHKKEQLDREFNDTVMRLAADLADKMEGTP